MADHGRFLVVNPRYRRAFCRRCGSPLPVPPGKSTYRIKGEFYRHLGATIAKLTSCG